jgi:exonuclease SbcC
VLQALRLKNFKKHADLSVQFSSGLNLITGPNYAGKSSILHGVLYALWGPTAVPGGSAVVQRQGGEQVEVELTLSLRNEQYRVLRKGQSATLFRGDQRIATSALNVSAELQEVLGLDKNLFLLLKYGEQGETKALLTLGAAELNKIIEKVGAVELVDQVIEQCGTISTVCQGQLLGLGNADPNKTVASLQAGVQEKYNSLFSIHEKVKSLTDDFTLADSNFVLAQTAEREGAASNLARAEILSKQAAIESSLKDALTERDGLKDSLEKLAIELIGETECEEQLATLRDHLQKKQAAQHMANQSAEMLEVQADQLQAASTRLAQLQDSKQRAGSMIDVTEASEQTAALKAAYEVAKGQLSELFTALKKSICPTCKRPYDASHVAHAEAQIEEQQQRVAELEPKLRTAQEVLQAGRERNEAIRTLEREIATVEGNIGRYEEACQQYREWTAKYREEGKQYESLEFLTTETARLTELCGQLRKRRGHQERTAASLQKIEEKITLLRQQVQSGLLVEIPPERDLEAAKRRTTERFAERQRIETELHAQRGLYSQEYAAYQQLSNELKALQETEIKRLEVQARKSTAGRLAKYLRANRDDFMTDTWEGVLSYASAFAANCTGGEISAVRRTAKGEFVYVEGDREMPVSAASGGQKSIMGLGVQLGLAELLPGSIGTVLLDEPTAELDQERSLALAAVLPTSSSQLIVVTHRPLDASAAATVVSL